MGRTIVQILRRRKVTTSVVMVALTLGVVSSAFAANGGNFILGVLSNSATAVTRLTMTGTANASVLQLIQQSTGTGASGLGITVPAGKAPITVNSTAGKATNLNADKLDSLDSTALQRRVSGTCAAGQSISSIAALGTVSCETDDDSGAALRSELGTTDAGGPNEASDPVSYSKLKDIPADVLNRNAATLDGKTASEFADSTHSHSGEQIDSGTVEADRIEDGPGSNLNADQLDGLDSSAFGTKTAHNFSFSDECDAPNTRNECAPISVTVPTGKTYLVSVWSSFTALGGASNQNVTFCSAEKDPGQTTPFCITPFTQFGRESRVTIEANQYGAAAASGESASLSAGTYVFSTAINPGQEFRIDDFGKVITKVLVRDASGATVSSASVSEQGAAMRER